MEVFVYAFFLGLALILPIGAQNLYLIQLGFKAGIKRAFVGSLITTFCDSVLITIGALGVGLILNQHPTLMKFRFSRE